MKITDLAIGDYIRVVDDDTDEYFIGTVALIDGDLENANVRKEGDSVGYPYSIDCLEPVLLTEEILKKNFPSPELLVWYPIGDAIHKFHCGTQVDGIQVSGQFREVHLLQHALRLAGIEKEITL